MTRRSSESLMEDTDLEQTTSKKLRPSDMVASSDSQAKQSVEDYKLSRIRQVIVRVLGFPAGATLPQSISAALNKASIDLLTDTGELNCVLDAVLLETLALVNAKPSAVASLCDDNSLFDTNYGGGGGLGFSEFQNLSGSAEERVFNYLLACYKRLRTEENNNWIDLYEKDVLEHFWVRLMAAFLMFMEGAFGLGNRQAPGALVVRGLMDQSTLPSDLLQDLVKYGKSDTGALESLFNPALNCVVRLANTTSLAKAGEQFRIPVRILHQLCSIQYTTPQNTKERPICTLLVNRADWMPSALSPAEGREISKLSFMGPFLSLSIFVEEDMEIAERFFSVDDLPQQSTKFVYGSLRNNLQLLRGDIHDALKGVLINAASRERALDYLTAVVDRNIKRAQMRPNEAQLAPDGFMLNFLAVMYELSGKVTLDKVNQLYPFHPQSRVTINEEARMKFDQEQVDKFVQTLDLNFERKFPTECFFLTVHAQHVTLIPALRRNKDRMDYLRHLNGRIKTSENDLQNETNPTNRAKLEAKIKNMKTIKSRLNKSRMCAEAALLDEAMLSRALTFCLKQLNFLIGSIAPNFFSGQAFELPTEAPALFGAYPEFYLEDVLDLLLLLLKNAPQVLIELCSTDLLTHVLVFVCNSEYFNNPFLAAKSIEVIFHCCPPVQPAAHKLHQSALQHPLAQKSLFPSLVKFYSDVESTGAHTEFFDKFSIRRNIQVIFKCLRDNALYRHLMIEYAKECGSEFVRFINMGINDSTFLLDESLNALKRIHEIEKLMDNKEEWDALGREGQRMKRGVLQQDQSSVTSWLTLGQETLDMFCYMSSDVREPFLKEILGSRLAAMLNYNLQELCGSKCVSLKVRNPEKYRWEPRKLLSQLVEIFLNLESQEFTEYVAKDERSYSNAMFETVLGRLHRNNIVPISQVERLTNIAEQAFSMWKTKTARDTDLYGDIPDEFIDPIMSTIMEDPVTLPTSGHIVDRKVIERILLDESIDPFSRAELKVEQLVPNPEMKARIEKWLQEKGQSK